MQKFPHLFSPIEIAGHTYRNRILSAPMIFGFMALRGGDAAERLYRMVENRARGGAAEVVIGETPVNYSDAPDIFFPGTEVDYAAREGPGFDAYRRYADLIKKHGAYALIQIFHAGHAKNPLPFGDRPNPWGPMGYIREDGVTVEAFDAGKMKKVRGDFVACSEFMKAAGFDGVLIHGAHGFLFTQFLSPSSNCRTDEYGGNLEKRGRFPREILKDIKDNLGKDFIVELRINGADLVEGGTTNEETAEFCSTLDGLVDIIHISSGFKSKGHDTEEFTSMYHPHGVHVERAANVKKMTNIPVTVVGGINSPEFAERVIAEGKVDFVSLARQLLADPEFPNKAGAGREDEIIRCVRCYHCYPGMPEIPGDDRAMLVPKHDEAQSNNQGGIVVGECAINPMAGNDLKIDAMPSPKGSRSVLVVGGGPAGMQAAITAADRGHRVTLAEKDGSLGGILYFTDTDVHKADLRDFKDLLIREVGRRSITILFNTEVTPAFIAENKPDALILAIGASPATPIPGLEKAIHALDVYKGDCRVGKRAIMLGGGLAGCETALHLADKGHEVIIVEMENRLAPDACGLLLTATIRQIEKRSSITAKTGMKCIEITPRGVKVENAAGESQEIEGDTIVYSLGMSARRAETESLRAAAGEATVLEVGDCVRGAKVFEAVSESFMAAMSII